MSRQKPQAREAEWYNQHYKARLDMGPWYRFLIPELAKHLRTDSQLLELGCGQGQLLDYLSKNDLLPGKQLHAIDQSQTAVDVAKGHVPEADIKVGDIYDLQFASGSMDVCVMMETIEHLTEPQVALAGIHRVLAPGGKLFISFPNFLHLPWLAVRLLSDLFNKPNWIVRQPIDKIYTVFGVIRIVSRAGFHFQNAVGSNYGPPVFYPLETDRVTGFLNRLGLWWISFHPILIFGKI